MVTLTETIYEKLIGASNDPAALEEVYHEYSSSKGPFYSALAKATASVTGRLKEISQKCEAADKHYNEKQQQIENSEHKLVALDKNITTKSEAENKLDGKLKEKQELLIMVKEVEGLGFGTSELSKLREVINNIAENQGILPKEAIPVFFQKVDLYQTVAFFEEDVKIAGSAAEKAKAEIELWQTKAKVAETKSKARIDSIEATERILARGVKEADLLQWDRILNKIGVPPQDVADTLEKFGSQVKALEQLTKQIENGKATADLFGNQIKELFKERDKVSNTIGALQNVAVKAVDKTAQSATGTMDMMAKKAVERISEEGKTAEDVVTQVGKQIITEMTGILQQVMGSINKLSDKAKEYGILERTCGELGREIILARAIRNRTPENWKDIAPGDVQEILAALLFWCGLDAENNLLMPGAPSDLSSKFYAHTVYDKIYLDEVIRWVSRCPFGS